MIRTVEEIRARREKIIASRKHRHVYKTYSWKEYKADPSVLQTREGICGFTLLNENGKPRIKGSWCHDPIVDEDWFDDVGVLLDVLDKVSE